MVHLVILDPHLHPDDNCVKSINVRGELHEFFVACDPFRNGSKPAFGATGMAGEIYELYKLDDGV